MLRKPERIGEQTSEEAQGLGPAGEDNLFVWLPDDVIAH
jgi:hypothetical protein